jgi:hypothetical protein
MRVFHIAILLIAFSAVACQQSNEVTTDLVNIPGSASGETDAEKWPIITFDNPEFDFGKIAEGELVKHTFGFTNTGKAPLILANVEPSCGCTAMRDWPKEPIHPGQKGSISIEFDSNKRPGFQRKSITVLANTVPARNLIWFQGEVVGPINTP